MRSVKPGKRLAGWFGYDLIRRARHGTLETHLAALLRHLEIELVIDVGANAGQYGQLLRKIGYTGRILSFEPAPGPLRALQEASRNDPRWEVVGCALGAEEDTARLNVMKESQLSSLRTPNEYARGLAPTWAVTETVEVPVRTLDAVMEGATDARTYLKMDTQGFDLEVLRGAERVLPSVLGLQSEMSVVPIYEQMPDYLTALATLKDLGFTLTGVYPVVRDKSTLAVIEFDCIMRRASGRGVDEHA